MGPTGIPVPIPPIPREAGPIPIRLSPLVAKEKGTKVKIEPIVKSSFFIISPPPFYVLLNISEYPLFDRFYL